MSKEDELAKEQAEVVPNTYGDLHDAPVEYIGEGGDGDDGAIEYRGCDLGDRKGLSEE